MLTDYSQIKKNILAFLENCPAACVLLDIARRENHKVYLVGGFLRDVFVGRSSKDVDFVSPTAVDLAKSVAIRGETKAMLIDRKFGTIRFMDRGEGEDACQVDLSPLRATTIVGDLYQRDFTINAFAVDMAVLLNDKKLELVDPLGGVLDLQGGRLRCCSENSFTDDPLRVLRGYRLLSTYGLTLEKTTKDKIIETRSGLTKIAAERIRDELVQILSAPNSFSVLAMLDEDDVLPILLPECMPMRHVKQDQFHHQDVWQHSLLALKTLEFFLSQPKKLVGIYADEPLALLSQKIAADRTHEIALKLAVLLHDMGKPSSRTESNDGDIHFHRHQIIGARLATSLCSRLRFSKNEIVYIGNLIRQQARPAYLFNLKSSSVKALTRFFGLEPEVFWSLLLLFAANYSAKRRLKDAVGSLSQVLRSWLDFYTEHLKPRENEPRLVDGHDLMARFDLPPGPTVGRLLRVLTDLQWEGEITTRQEALNRTAQLLKQWRIMTSEDRNS